MQNTKKQPVTLDPPENITIGIGLFYCLVGFFIVPYLFIMILNGMAPSLKAYSWVELGFHTMNFCFVFGLFREYLQDSWYGFATQKKAIFRIVGFAVLAMLVAYGAIYLYCKSSAPSMKLLAIYGTLPLTDMGMTSLSSSLVQTNPLAAMLIFVVFSPFICACLFYAAAFLPAFNKHPLLGYLAVAVITILPHYSNANTLWNAETQTILYWSQLPIHLVACWSYHKTDSIFAPMLSLAGANLISCGWILLQPIL